jgi:O-antigen/teichoic acid export membrane protein
MSFGSLISILANHGEKIVLSVFASPAAVGIYSVAKTIPKTLQRGVKKVLTPITMKLAGEDRKTNRDLLKKWYFPFLSVSIIGSIISWFAVPWIIDFLFGQKYMEAIFYSQLLLINLSIIPLNLMILNLSIYQSQGDGFVIFQSGRYFFKLLLLIALIPFFSIFGIIIAVILTNFLMFSFLSIWLFMFEGREISI